MTHTSDPQSELRPHATPVAAVRRVLHVGRVGFIGGAENVLLTSASGLQDMGIEAFLACPEGPLRDRADALGLTTIPLALSRMRISASPLKLGSYFQSWRNYSRKLEAICRQHAIELVHVHHPVTALYCSRGRQTSRTPSRVPPPRGAPQVARCTRSLSNRQPGWLPASSASRLQARSC